MWCYKAREILPERRSMKVEHKEFIEAARNLMDTFFVCFGDPGRGEVKNRSFTTPMALLEISKALNRIADEMCRQWAYNKTERREIDEMKTKPDYLNIADV